MSEFKEIFTSESRSYTNPVDYSFRYEMNSFGIQTFDFHPSDNETYSNYYHEKIRSAANELSPMETNALEEFQLDEPSLLEELEIYPDRILEKVSAVLNPFHRHSLADDVDFLVKDPDLAGPLSFCLVMAVSLFLSGNKVPFGYIYGLSVISCILMYCLLNLMTIQSVFTITNVTSILGYSLLPIVGLAVLGVVTTFRSTLGYIVCSSAVFWASLSSSRLFVAVTGDFEQRLLVAYPCVLIYGIFALLIVF